jgi:hypothetical protein
MPLVITAGQRYELCEHLGLFHSLQKLAIDD